MVLVADGVEECQNPRGFEFGGIKPKRVEIREGEQPVSQHVGALFDEKICPIKERK